MPFLFCLFGFGFLLFVHISEFWIQFFNYITQPKPGLAPSWTLETWTKLMTVWMSSWPPFSCLNFNIWWTFIILKKDKSGPNHGRCSSGGPSHVRPSVPKSWEAQPALIYIFIFIFQISILICGINLSMAGNPPAEPPALNVLSIPCSCIGWHGFFIHLTISRLWHRIRNLQNWNHDWLWPPSSCVHEWFSECYDTQQSTASWKATARQCWCHFLLRIGMDRNNQFDRGPLHNGRPPECSTHVVPNKP